MPVIDASVLVALLAGRELSEEAGERIQAEPDSFTAPHLIDAEVGHALRRQVRGRLLDEEDALQALEELADLPIERFSHTILLDSAWDLRSNLSFYDALYVALARELETGLVTLDSGMARAARGLVEEIELLGG